MHYQYEELVNNDLSYFGSRDGVTWDDLVFECTVTSGITRYSSYTHISVPKYTPEILPYRNLQISKAKSITKQNECAKLDAE